MRQIKFRAWDSVHEKMLYAGECRLSLNLFGHVFDDVMAPPYKISYRRLQFPEVMKLMQYTGLLDKNGTEIYEGDIVEWTIWPEDFNRAAPIEKRIRDVVAFSKSGSWVAEERHEILGLKEPHRSLEVIGNIYENKDLLK